MGKVIMIIDDAAAIRQSVGYSLQEAGFDVIEAEHGEDALKKLKSMKVDLIVCDVNMPVMDGLTFLRKIKNEDEYAAFRFAPIIMLTTESGQDSKEEGKKFGAKVWMVKPFKPEQLIDAVKKLIH
ncbi:MAG: response regulator [Spirochaetes bacterium]|nr:response regulator [Spirochaetota bacterium]